MNATTNIQVSMLGASPVSYGFKAINSLESVVASTLTDEFKDHLCIAQQIEVKSTGTLLRFRGQPRIADITGGMLDRTVLYFLLIHNLSASLPVVLTNDVGIGVPWLAGTQAGRIELQPNGLFLFKSDAGIPLTDNNGRILATGGSVSGHMIEFFAVVD